jgi:diadenosine tetraphosphate (Ap4A) HIT family hydrolase
MTESCLACDVIGGRLSPVGGIVLATEDFAVHGIAAPSPIPGWMVLTSVRHVRNLDGLPDTALAALGPLLARVIRAQKSALAAEHVYVFAIGDAVKHLHVHLVPRFAETPQALRGRGAFEAKPAQMLADSVLAEAVKKLRSALG